MCKERICFLKPIAIFVAFLVYSIATYQDSMIPVLEAKEASESKSPAGLKPTGKTPKTPVIEPKAEQLLREMGAFLKKAKHFSFHAEIIYDDLLPSGQKIQFAAAEDVSVQRPDQIYVDYQSDIGSKKFWYNGKNITLLSVSYNKYSTIDAPPNIDSALYNLMKEYGYTIPLGDFLFSDPNEALKENVLAGIYVGPGDVNGVDCHHLAFVEKYIDWQIWIENGKEPVPRKIVITYKTMPQSPQYIAILSDWNFKKSFPDSLFSAKLPKDSERIEFIKLTSSKEKN